MGVEKGAVLIKLNPDGSIPDKSKEFLQKFLPSSPEEKKPAPQRLSTETPLFDVVLYYTLREENGIFGLVQTNIQPDYYLTDKQNPEAVDVLAYAISQSPFVETDIQLEAARIQRRSVREAMLGDLSDEDLVKLYRLVNGPRPIYSDLAALAEIARGQQRITDD